MIRSPPVTLDGDFAHATVEPWLAWDGEAVDARQRTEHLLSRSWGRATQSLQLPSGRLHKCLTAVTTNFLTGSSPPLEKTCFQVWHIVVVDVALVLCAYFLIWPTTADKSREFLFYASAFAIAPIAGAVLGPKLFTSLASRFFSYLAPPFSALVAVLALDWSTPFLTPDNRKAFWWGCTMTWAAGIWHLMRTSRSTARVVEFVCAVAGFFILLLLFANPLRIDTGHNGPYLGPALNVLHGGRPMLDVFSQYGLAYLVYAVAILWSDYSIPAVVALVSAFNLTYFAAAAFIAWKLGSHRGIPVLFTVFGIVALVGYYPVDFNNTPAVGGMRFLPLFLLLAALIAESKWKSVLLFVLVPIASLWSLESCFYSLCLLAGYLFLESRRAQNPFAISIWRAAAALAYVVIPHAAVTAAWLAWYGELPNYPAYFQLLGAYVGTDGAVDPNGAWTLSPTPGFRLLLFHVAAYTSVLSVAVAASGRLGVEDTKNITALACVAIVGSLQLAYFTARSTIPLLVCVSLPLIILIVYIFETSTVAVRSHARSIAAWSVFCAVLFIVGLIGGSAWSRLSRTPMTRNWHELIACFRHDWHDCLITIRQIERSSEPFNPAHLVPNPYVEQAKDAYAAIKRLEGNGSRVHALISETPMLYFYLRQPLPWGLSNPVNDGLSSILTARAMAAAEHDVKDGEYILIARDPPLWQISADTKILDALRKRFNLCREVGQTSYLHIDVVRVSGSECSFDGSQKKAANSRQDN